MVGDGLIVNLFAIAHLNHQNTELAVLNIANHAVISYAITPVRAEDIANERYTNASRVV